jgi:hypothetical protein
MVIEKASPALLPGEMTAILIDRIPPADHHRKNNLIIFHQK